nr:UTP--glucose-1-phosphate uridylyltransferase [Parablautia intestinalis]
MVIIMDYAKALEKLAAAGQEHAMQYYEELSKEQKALLLGQIEATDFTVLSSLKERKEENVRGDIKPLAAMQLGQIKEKEKEFRALGLNAIREGKVGAVLLAGGMGTRLGSDDPKGMYNIGLTKEVYIFQRLIENLLDVVKEAGAWVPLYVMTSDKNHENTVRFLKERDYFGYNSEYVTFFMQEMAPACDHQGKVYMEEKWKISTSPNGNGGWYSSMHKWGVSQKAMADGVEWLNVFAVDNVLQRIADPCFVGAVLSGECASGAKVVRKCAPDEKIGVICLEDGKPSIVEYYELTDELMNAKDENGDPAYYFGVILNYLFRVGDLEKIRERKLPLHIVEKKIPYLNEKGEKVKPDAPNGYKFEQLVLDMIHELDGCLPFEVVREKEFAPIKNATGIDSVESARELCKKNGIEL